jgi:hypothetical protein
MCIVVSKLLYYHYRYTFKTSSTLGKDPPSVTGLKGKNMGIRIFVLRL